MIPRKQRNNPGLHSAPTQPHPQPLHHLQQPPPNPLYRSVLVKNTIKVTLAFQGVRTVPILTHPEAVANTGVKMRNKLESSKLCDQEELKRLTAELEVSLLGSSVYETLRLLGNCGWCKHADVQVTMTWWWRGRPVLCYGPLSHTCAIYIPNTKHASHKH